MGHSGLGGIRVGSGASCAVRAPERILSEAADLAEKERALISQRTKAALAAKKAQGEYYITRVVDYAWSARSVESVSNMLRRGMRRAAFFSRLV